MSTPVVSITGVPTGIGRAAAFAFAQQGNRIVVSGRHGDAGETLVRELRALGTEAEFIRADIRHEDDVRDLVDRTVGRFGRLDAAVNIAGTEGQPGPVTQQTADSYVFRRSRVVSSLGMSSITSCPHASSSRHQWRSPALV
jgi:NAD(P)-dependent dehydrogenase (short-subunit alcohol dehydrogenase family)